MPRLPRSRRIVEELRPETIELKRRALHPGPAGAEYRQALCPVCGVGHSLHYWENIQVWDPNKPLGTIQESRGKGSFQLLGYFGPEDDFFPLLRCRFLASVKEWVDKGWVTREAVSEAMR